MKNPKLFTPCLSVVVAGAAACFCSTAAAQNPHGTPMTPVSVSQSQAAAAQDSDAPEKAGSTKKSTTTDTAKKTTTTGKAATTGGELSKQDSDFLKEAAKDNMKEVHMAQMATEHGQSADVKKMGSQIASDHRKANEQLMELAEKKGVKIDTKHKMDKMSKKDMENFDQAWLAMMVKDHQKDIAEYQRQAQQGTDPDVKSFVKKTLPVLQKHLKMVQNAQKKMGAGTATERGTTTGSPSPAATKSGR